MTITKTTARCLRCTRRNVPVIPVVFRSLDKRGRPAALYGSALLCEQCYGARPSDADPIALRAYCRGVG